jgi:hypothetical protein
MPRVWNQIFDFLITPFLNFAKIMMNFDFSKEAFPNVILANIQTTVGND